MSEPIIPRLFRERYRKILGNDVKKFIEYCKKPLTKSIRINTLKIEKERCIDLLEARGWKLKQIPWYENGYWVVDRGKSIEEEQLGNTLEHFMGYFYIQEASSMIPPVVLNPSKKDYVLDMAAAPGSKTTQMAEMMRNKGCIVANDVQISRLKILRFNIEKLGVMNAVVTRMDGRKFKKFKNRFDKVLIDAPCSSEGTIRKDWKVLSRWNIKVIKGMTSIQKRLLEAAVVCVKRGGTVVYSTCTLAPEENEAVIDYILRKFDDVDVEKVNLKGLKTREGITEWENREFDERVKFTARIWPQDNNTEGFFVAKLVKV